MSNVYESNAARLRELDAAIKTTCKKRHERARQMKAWEDACRTFHESFDRLAFPGGLAKAMHSVKAGDSAVLEMAVRFLEADPRFFRSGYIKADLIKLIRQAQLGDDQRVRLQQVILTRIQGQDVREFRSYCQLARVISDADFESQVVALAASPVSQISRHAKWVLAQLQQQRPNNRKHLDV
jgi:hypothetical protein